LDCILCLYFEFKLLGFVLQVDVSNWASNTDRYFLKGAEESTQVDEVLRELRLRKEFNESSNMKRTSYYNLIIDLAGRKDVLGMSGE